MNPECTVPTGELSVGRQARSPLGNNGPKVESPLVSPGLALLSPLVVLLNEVTALAGGGVTEALALLTEAAGATATG
jgi:hypothetical protein